MAGTEHEGAAGSGPAEAVVAEIERLRHAAGKGAGNDRLGDAYREILRGYRALVAAGETPGGSWAGPVRGALAFLGGQSDRNDSSLADYDHRRYGPFLGVSNEGRGAATISEAAHATPKAQALGPVRSALTIGVAVDGEVLGGVGEVPVGPDEFADIWSACAGRTLMTTNVGSRANLRFYRQAPLVTVGAGESGAVLDTAKVDLAAAFKPFLDAPGGPRPLIVFVEFASDSGHDKAAQLGLLQALQAYVQAGTVAAPDIHQLGLNVAIGGGAAGRDTALAGIDLADSAGIRHVAVEGAVRRDADRALSLPGLLNYLPAAMVQSILERAEAGGIQVGPLNQVDADTVARQIWSALNTARAMGLDLGKYGLFPLTLEECDVVVGHIQGWFPDWTAAPVFYVDQGLLSRGRVYALGDLEEGLESWLRVVAGHQVRLVLIDTVDKAKGWKILKTGGDPKGLLELDQIARLNALGEQLGVRMMWAGGITAEQAHEFGKLGVFGVYVTTAVAEPAPVSGDYLRDPGLASEKRPTRDGILKVKSVIEAGYLAESLAGISPQTDALRELRARIDEAGLDAAALAQILPDAWRAWWQHG